MSSSDANEVNVLKLSLHNQLVGYLVGYKNGRNVLGFAEEFRSDSARSTFGLITHPDFPNAHKIMSEPWVRNQRLHPLLSNLLPEGALRELMAQGLKTHVDNEFQLLSYLGDDLPGALMAEPMEPEEVPQSVLSTHGTAKPVRFDRLSYQNKFSLAGVQMKFSMKEIDGRYNLATNDGLGDWIIKTPSTQHKDVPLNEYTAMKLASMVGVDIPPVKLVEMNKLDNLPPINLPNEELAFAIKRFDREDGTRIHMEDFAQVFVKYPHEKYASGNYEQIGRVLYRFSGEGLADVQQLARRLLVNILLANGDAHLKNWSLLYADKITPRLSPAYDIVTTRVYIQGERQYALNLGKTKNWYGVSYNNFRSWAEHSDIPWRAIKPHLDDVMERARALWPDGLRNLPMNNVHKDELRRHWRALYEDFSVKG